MNLKNLFLLLFIVSLVIGLGAIFLDHNSSSTVGMVEGIAKGMAGIFFILFYIFMLLGKQPIDKTTH